jgi:hypothetical protein
MQDFLDFFFIDFSNDIDNIGFGQILFLYYFVKHLGICSPFNLIQFSLFLFKGKDNLSQTSFSHEEWSSFMIHS